MSRCEHSLKLSKKEVIAIGRPTVKDDLAEARACARGRKYKKIKKKYTADELRYGPGTAAFPGGVPRDVPGPREVNPGVSA